MGTDGSELVETLPNPRSFKVHKIVVVRICLIFLHLIPIVILTEKKLEAFYSVNH